MDVRMIVFDEQNERSIRNADLLTAALYAELSPTSAPYGSDGAYGHDPDSAQRICDLTSLTHDFDADPVRSQICLEPEFSDVAEAMAASGWDVTKHDVTVKSNSTGTEEKIDIGYYIDIAASKRNFSGE